MERCLSSVGVAVSWVVLYFFVARDMGLIVFSV